MQFDAVPLQLPAERFRVATDMCRKARLSGVVAVGCGNITVGMKMRGQFFERKCYFGAANVFTLWERNRAYRCPPTHRCPHKRFQLICRERCTAMPHAKTLEQGRTRTAGRSLRSLPSAFRTRLLSPLHVPL